MLPHLNHKRASLPRKGKEKKRKKKKLPPERNPCLRRKGEGREMGYTGGRERGLTALGDSSLNLKETERDLHWGEGREYSPDLTFLRSSEKGGHFLKKKKGKSSSKGVSPSLGGGKNLCFAEGEKGMLVGFLSYLRGGGREGILPLPYVRKKGKKRGNHLFLPPGQPPWRKATFKG